MTTFAFDIYPSGAYRAQRENYLTGTGMRRAMGGLGEIATSDFYVSGGKVIAKTPAANNTFNYLNAVLNRYEGQKTLYAYQGGYLGAEHAAHLLAVLGFIRDNPQKAAGTSGPGGSSWGPWAQGQINLLVAAGTSQPVYLGKNADVLAWALALFADAMNVSGGGGETNIPPTSDPFSVEAVLGYTLVPSARPVSRSLIRTAQQAADYAAAGHTVCKANAKGNVASKWAVAAVAYYRAYDAAKKGSADISLIVIADQLADAARGTAPGGGGTTVARCAAGLKLVDGKCVPDQQTFVASTPFYKKGWFWGLLGACAVGAAVFAGTGPSKEEKARKKAAMQGLMMRRLP